MKDRTADSSRTPANVSRVLFRAIIFGIAGGGLGFIAPLTYGVYAITSVRAATLPAGQGACGMPVLGGIVMIVVGCPFLGLVFAGIGAAIGAISTSVDE